MCGGEPETQAGPALSFCGPGRGWVEGLLFASTHDLGNYWQRPSLLHLSGAPGFQGPVRPHLLHPLRAGSGHRHDVDRASWAKACH
jgi:hypothetical protein